MKIQVLSDLHNEFGQYQVVETDADVIVLAGDINLKDRAVPWAKTFGKPVIYVAGNHEYYGGALGYTKAKIKETCKDSNVHFLDNDEVIIDGVRFLGTTLWVDFRLTGNEALAMWDAHQRMNDYKKIRATGFQRLRPEFVQHQFIGAKRFLAQKLSQPEYVGKTVVVTHHAPCGLSIHDDYKNARDHLNASYASDLTQLMGEHVPLWIHGHTHHNFDYEVAGTRVVCNPRGYHPDHLNDEFKDDLVVEV